MKWPIGICGCGEGPFGDGAMNFAIHGIAAAIVGLLFLMTRTIEPVRWDRCVAPFAAGGFRRAGRS